MKAPRYTKSVLLVDDVPSDLVLFKRLLERADFRVIATTQADTALSCVVAGDVGCVITDVNMPIPGQELATLMQGVRLDVSVIFLSGADGARAAIPPGAILINKDDKQTLLETVTHCMSAYKAA